MHVIDFLGNYFRTDHVMCWSL